MSHKDVCFPQTFSLSIEKIIMQNLEENPGIKVGGLILNNLRHSDDTVLMPANKEDLQQLLDIVEEESRKKGLELNSKSTEVMVVSGSNERPQTNIFINVNKLKQRNKFKFNIKWWTQLHWNCIKNSSSKKRVSREWNQY